MVRHRRTQVEKKQESTLKSLLLPPSSRNKHSPKDLPLLLQNHQPRIFNNLTRRGRTRKRRLRNLRRTHNSWTHRLHATSSLPPHSRALSIDNNPLRNRSTGSNFTPRTHLRVRTDIRAPTNRRQSLDCSRRMNMSTGFNCRQWTNSNEV